MKDIGPEDILTEDILLYQFYHPKGVKLSSLRQFHTDKELIDQGWTKDPDKIVKVKSKKSPSVTQDQADKASPDVLVGLVQSLGFNVLTDDQLNAEIVKGRISSPGLISFSDKELQDETDRRKLKMNVDMMEALRQRFIADPEELNKEELVVFGKDGLGLKLAMTMKEKTLIGYIAKAISLE